MNDIAELLRRLAVATATQVGGNRAQQRIDLLERLVIQTPLLQVSMENRQALPDHVARGHACAGRLHCRQPSDLFRSESEVLTRKLKQVVGLRQTVVGMRVLRRPSR
ncbi:MAG: hypothetical protein ACLRM9_00335 [Collinsella aerofaciens]